MYEYFRALHRRFFHEQEHTDLSEEAEHLRQEVESCLDSSGRKTLLRLLDAENRMKDEISLDSFTAGFKLAAGLAKELEADGLYSFDAEIELQEAGRVHRQE